MFLQGGLGNQLFQFAAGYEQSQKLQTSLILDCSRLKRDSNREFALSNLLLPEGVFVDPGDGALRRIAGLRITLRLRKTLGFKDFIEQGTNYDESINKVKAGAWMDGYFQSPKYFENVSEAIFELLLNAPLPAIEMKKMEAKSIEPFIAVHVRQGDYTKPEVAAIHGLCTKSFFSNALRLMQGQLPGRRLMYFSDDPLSASEYLDLDAANFVTDSFGDISTIKLMAAGDGIIISNSTFSWWAGWFGSKSHGAAVLAPKPWFAENDAPSLIPHDWLRYPRA